MQIGQKVVCSWLEEERRCIEEGLPAPSDRESKAEDAQNKIELSPIRLAIRLTGL